MTGSKASHPGDGGAGASGCLWSVAGKRAATNGERIVQARLFSALLAHRTLVVVLVTVFTAFLGFFALQVRFDNTIESYFLEEDVRAYNRFLDLFSTDEFLAIGFGGEEVFTGANLALIDRMSSELATMPHVRRVVSLTTVKVALGTTDFVSFETLVPTIPSGPDALAMIRRRAFADPVVASTVLSPDAAHTAIVAEIEHRQGEFDYKIDLLRRVRSLLTREEARTGKDFRLAGTAVLDDALFRYTRRDQERFFPLMLLIVVVVLYAGFRDWIATLLPLLVVILSVIWAYGFMVLLGYKINVISSILGPLLLSVGIADSVHFIGDYRRRIADGHAPGAKTVETSFCDLLVPCVMTTVTTILGLLSLLIADLAPIRQFGIVAAIGVFAALVITFTLLPIMLPVLPVGRASVSRRKGTGLVDFIVGRLGTWRRRQAICILTFCVLVVIPAALSATRVTVGTNSLDYFRRHDEVRRETEWIDDNVAGTASLEFLVDAGPAETLLDPAVFEKIDRFEAYLRGIDGITAVYSVVDVVKALNRALGQGEQREFRIPSSKAALAQVLLVVEGSDEIEALASADYSRARITARVAMDASSALAHRMPEIEAEMGRIFGASPTVSATGLVRLLNQMERYLLASQIKSFVVAFIVVGFCILVMLRSWKLGLLALIPNFLPLLCIIGLMPVLGIALDVGTVMIASVALGLIVDDTIHFMYRLKAEAVSAHDMPEAIALALHESAGPIIHTSLVLSAGFAVLIFASFNPVVHFGVLASTVTLLALGFDLVVLPALMGFVRVATVEETPRSTPGHPLR
jgi:predicted RND superfamily exporter protein